MVLLVSVKFATFRSLPKRRSGRFARDLRRKLDDDERFVRDLRQRKVRSTRFARDLRDPSLMVVGARLRNVKTKFEATARSVDEK